MHGGGPRGLHWGPILETPLPLNVGPFIWEARVPPEHSNVLL